MLGYLSEEGVEVGFGWFDFMVKCFFFLLGLCIFYMGWSEVGKLLFDYLFVEVLGDDIRFYFVYSYYFFLVVSVDMLFLVNYGIFFVVGVVRDNIVGV